MSLPKRHSLIAAILFFLLAIFAASQMSTCEENERPAAPLPGLPKPAPPSAGSSRVGPERGGIGRVVVPAAIYLSLSAADLGTTEWAVRHGYTEANPLMQSHRIEKGLAVAGAFLAADLYLQKREQPTAAKVLRVTYAVARVGAVALSVRNMRRGR